MSSTPVPFLTLVSTRIAVYLGSIIFISGILGGLLNTLVFLSLRTFRQNSCAFYLTLASIVDIGQLLTGLLSRLMINAFNIDWTTMTPVYCKLRIYLIQVFTLTSLTSICLATMDQYFATSIHLQRRQWSQIKMAHRLSAINILFWTLYFIPYLIFYNLTIKSTNGTGACTITNNVFLQYVTYFHIPVVFGPLPLLITVIFALLAYYNIKQIPYRTVPLVRRELDKQMTTMVLVQVICNVLTIVPFVVMFVITNSLKTTTIEIDFLLAVSISTYFIYSASPFYINICASKRFRSQLYYVLIDIHLKRWRRTQINPIDPEFHNNAMPS